MRRSHARAVMWAVLYLGASLFAAGRAAGTEWYVDGLGDDDANSGLSGSPFREIRKALTVAAAGDTIHAGDGQYKGFDLFDFTATEANPLIIIADTDNAELMPTPLADRGHNDTVYLDNCTYVTLDGFKSFDARRAAVRLQSCSFVTVRNGTYGDNQTWGIFTGHCDDLVIEYNECYGSVDQHGIYVSNSGDRPTVRGNILHDNSDNGLHMNGDINTPPGDGIISNALVEDNVIYSNGTGGGSGINCDGVQNSVIRNNVLYDAKAAGISLYRIDGGGPSTGNLVVNNTVEVSSTGRWALQLHDGAANTTVFNNILLNLNTSRGSIHMLGTGNLTGLKCDRNVLTTNTHVATVDDDSTYDTFALWQARGFDTNSVTATSASLFVGGGDYHLKTGAAAIDLGVATFNSKSAPTLDREGNGRPSGTAFDAGAFEFGGVPPNEPPTIDSGPDATPNPVQTGEFVAFSVAATDPENGTLTYDWDFGDGNSGNGDSPLYAYAAAGNYLVTLTVSDGTNDVVETLNVTVADTIGALAADKLSIKMSFAKPLKDACSAKGRLTELDAAFAIANAAVSVEVAGVRKTWTLDEKGKAKTIDGTVRFKLSKKLGWTFTAKFAKGDYAATWDASGLTDGDFKNAPRSVTVIVEVGGAAYGQDRDVLYTAKTGKTGRAKQTKL